MLDLGMKKIDWTNFNVLTLDSKQSVFFNCEDFGIGKTEIAAEEYFTWAKQVIDKGENITTREIVEIISNIKRFIDCKCQNFIRKYGFINNIDDKNYPYFNKLIKKESISVISLTSYLLNLNLIIIDEVRKLRNKIEHDYTRPTFNDAERAVAVGELFLLAFNNKLSNIRYYCEISSKKYVDKFNIVLYRKGEDPFNSNSCIEINGIEVNSSEMEYSIILKVLINGCFSEIPAIFNNSTPSEYIKFKEYFDEDFMNIDNDSSKGLF